MAATRSSRLWLVARILLGASLIPLAIAASALILPVRNPGVQDCGSPAAFLVQGRNDARMPIAGDSDYTPTTPTLVAQPRCTARVEDRLIVAAVAGAAFLLLAAAGAVSGLVDDTVRLHRSPKFERLLRERPVDAPGLYWDRPVVPATDLGVRLPEIETREVVLLGLVTIGVWIVLGWLAGLAGLLDTLRAVRPMPVVVLLALSGVAVLASAAQFTAIRTDRWPLGRALAVAAATCSAARVRPSFGWSGNWLHNLVRAGTDRASALCEVSCIATMGVLVHGVMVGTAALVVLVVGVDRYGLAPSAWMCLVTTAVVLVWGASSAPARYHQLLAPPGRPGLRTLGALARSEPGRFAGLAAAAVVLASAESLALVASLAAVNGRAPVVAVLSVALVAVALGQLGPVPDGVGVIEAIAVLGLWRFGVDGPAAVAAVVMWRVGLRWLPMAPGAVVASRASSKGRQPSSSGVTGSAGGP